MVTISENGPCSCWEYVIYSICHRKNLYYTLEPTAPDCPRPRPRDRCELLMDLDPIDSQIGDSQSLVITKSTPKEQAKKSRGFMVFFVVEKY